MTPLHSSRARVRIAIGCLASLVLGACSDPIYYSADSITGRVVDAATKEPLAGVNIVAGWELKGGLEGGNSFGWVMVMEAVTDATGAFAFPAWGPKRHDGRGLIYMESPLIMLFTSGYTFEELYDYIRRFDEFAPFSRDKNKPIPIQSYWNGKTIELKRFTGDLEQYAEKLQHLDTRMDSLLSTDECNFKAMPKFLLAIDQQSKALRIAQTRWQLPDLDHLSISYRSQCGSLKKSVEDHSK